MELPENINLKLAQIKEERKKYIMLMIRNGHYYVYESTSKWDKLKKKVKSKVTYIGRINNEGEFLAVKSQLSLTDAMVRHLPKEIRRQFENLKEQYGYIYIDKIETDRVNVYQRSNLGTNNLIGIIKRNGTFESTADHGGSSLGNNIISNSDQKILTCLSMNGRIPLSRLAEISGISKRQAYHRVKVLEKKFAINYIAEINTNILGYTPYLVLIKFEESKPSQAELESIIKNQPYIQFAATLRGEYDLLIYILDSDFIKTEENLWNFRSLTSIGKYRAEWYITPFRPAFSFIPLRDLFIEQILKEKISPESKDTGFLKSEQLKHRDIILLKALNSNGIKNFNKIDEDYKLAKGAARYAYHQLRKKKILKRITVSLSFPIKYIGIIKKELMHAEEAMSVRPQVLSDVIQYGQICNKYAFVCVFGLPEGNLYFLPITQEGELDKIKSDLEKFGKGSRFKSLIIENTIVGSLCYRRFDVSYSSQYAVLSNYQKTKAPIIIDDSDLEKRDEYSKH